MEIVLYRTALELKNGVVTIENQEALHEYFLPMVDEIRMVLEPIIKEGNVSGTIEIKAYDNKAKVNYIGIKPIEFVAPMVAAIVRADSYASYR